MHYFPPRSHRFTRSALDPAKALMERAGALVHSTLSLAGVRLDLVAWATGLPALGPEALLVQIATRPASFGPWADLVPHLDDLVADCSDERLERLLSGRPTSAWQRASYLLDSGGEPARGQALLAKRHTEVMPVTRFTTAHSRDRGESVWAPEYQLVDELVVPLLRVIGKA